MTYKIECLVCGEIFKSDFNGREKANLAKHLSKHNMTAKEYSIKYFYNGTEPKCTCGCGESVRFNNFKFKKYFSNHKNYTTVSIRTRKKLRKISLERYTIDWKLKNKNVTVETLKTYFEIFKKCEKSLIEIQNILKIDRRVLREYWIELKLTTDKEMKELSKNTKFLGFKRNIETKKISEDELYDILLYLEDCQERITYKKLKIDLNLKYHYSTIHRALINKFGEDFIKTYLIFGRGGTSKLECDFFFVLKHFFNNRIKAKFNLENKIYDYILDDKFIIELDGSYWHSTEKSIKNDSYKDELAMKYGYEIIRISEKEYRNFNIIQKINNISKNIKK